MSVRDDVRELLEGVPEERLEDVRTYLEHLRDADCAWKWWQQQHGAQKPMSAPDWPWLTLRPILGRRCRMRR